MSIRARCPLLCCVRGGQREQSGGAPSSPQPRGELSVRLVFLTNSAPPAPASPSPVSACCCLLQLFTRCMPESTNTGVVSLRGMSGVVTVGFLFFFAKCCFIPLACEDDNAVSLVLTKLDVYHYTNETRRFEDFFPSRYSAAFQGGCHFIFLISCCKTCTFPPALRVRSLIITPGHRTL